MARQVLTIGGAIVGAAFGMPQLGFALGSLIGNAVDPVQIQGPKLGDMAIQTSRDGVPRPIVFGVAAVSGNIIDRSEPKIVKKKERAGKGGPETITEHVYMSYAIRVCEGPVTSISRIWENEKLVYDVTPGSTIADDAAKFLEKVTFYYGDESQLPDPTLEAIHGVGSTPAYRGTCYAVWNKKDLTEFGGAIPQYRFEVNGIIVESTSETTGVISLLHADSFNGDTTFIDEVTSTGTWAIGLPYISTAQSKFGGSSFECAHATKTVGRKELSGVTWAANTPYTAEGWFYYDGAYSTQDKIFFNLDVNSGSSALCELTILATTHNLRFDVTSSGSVNTGVPMPINTWSHLAVSSTGSTHYLYLNGVKIGELSGINTFTNTHYWRPSTSQRGGFNFGGFIDEVRLTYGINRYPNGTTFTPRATPFPNP